MKFRKVIESGIITAALALTSVTTAVSASAAETGTTTESATVNANVADRVSQAASTGVQLFVDQYNRTHRQRQKLLSGQTKCW